MRTRGHLRSLSLFLVIVLSTGCDSDSPFGPIEEVTALPRDLTPSETLLIDAGNDFAFDLLRMLQEEEPSSNLFVSPFSASMALGMTLNGTQEDTYRQMRDMLGFEGMSLEEINQGYRDLLALLASLDPTVQLGVGNSIWYREGFPVIPGFLDRVREHFDAVVSELDFSDPRAPGVINGWVRDETKGRIKTILDNGIDPASVMFLINTTYFKGTWRTRFDKGLTTSADFIQEDGRRSTVPLMTLSDSLPYTETELFQAVDLPYGAGAFSMTVLLPREGRSVEEVATSLTPGSWAGLTGSFQVSPGTIYLPRFRMEWEKVLNPVLKSLGMVDAFTPGLADFSRLSDVSGLFVNEVRQKSFVEVDEKGTEAAAATVVDIRLTANPHEFHLRADRPFLFVIRERLTNTILFAGGFMSPPEG